MITEGQEVVERTNSHTFCLTSTNKNNLSQTSIGVFLICSVSDIIFVIIFLPKPSRATSGPLTTL
jgi:hypothetical protein